MNGRTHLAGGLLAGVAAASALHLSLPFIVGAALAGPLPDVDHPGSMYGRFVPLPGVMVRNCRVEAYHRGPLFGASRMGGRAGRELPGGKILWHRGPTHSLFFAVAASIVAAIVPMIFGAAPSPAIGLGVFAGCLSHLALDLLNMMGLQILWPFRRKAVRFKWPRVRVGSLGERVVFGLLLLGTFAVGSGMLHG